MTPFCWAKMMRALLVSLAVSALLSACGAAAPTPILAPVKLSISNGTTIPVALVVNGNMVKTIAPGGYEDPVESALPALPWAVET